jgi:4-hydroxybenzoate polyprenyltransferase
MFDRVNNACRRDLHRGPNGIGFEFGAIGRLLRGLVCAALARLDLALVHQTVSRAPELVPGGRAALKIELGWIAKIIRCAIRNRVHLWPGAALIVWAFPPWYGSTPSWAALPSITLAGFGLYQLNRIFDGTEDAINDPSAYARLTATRPIVRTAAMAAIAASLLLSAILMSGWATATLAMMLLLGGLYSVPFLTRGLDQPRRLKQIPGLKNAVPSIVWPVTTILYPAIASPGVRMLPLVLALTGLGCVVFTVEVAWDLRDMRGDRAAGINTLATALGVHRALWIPISISGLEASLILLLIYARALATPWLLPALLLVLLPMVAYCWKEALALSRDRSHLLVVVNVLALVPIYLIGRWDT